MALIQRISRLFVADVNDLIDQIEEPAALLRQAVRDMAAEVTRGEQALAQCRRDAGRCESRIDRLADELTSVSEKVTLAMDAEDAGLAREMLRRRLLLEQHVARSRQQLQALRTRASQREERLADWRVRLDTTRQKLAAVTREQAEPDADHGIAVSSHDVEAAYLAELKKRGGS